MSTSSRTNGVCSGSTQPSLWRSGLHTLGTGIVSIPLGIVSSVVIARALGPAGKGSYNLIFATAALLGMVLGFSLPSGVTYVVARGKANLRSMGLRLVWIALLQGLLAAVILCVLQRTTYSAAFLPPAMRNWLIIAAMSLSVVFAALSSYWGAMLIGRQQIIALNWRDLAGRVVLTMALLGIGAAVALGHQASVPVFVWVSIGVSALTSLLLLQALRAFLYRSHGVSGLMGVVAYASPCYLANLAQFLNYRLDVFIVSFFAGIEAVGLYILAVTLSQFIWLVSKSAARVLLPRIAALQEAVSENALVTVQAARMTLWTCAALALFLAVFANRVVPWAYGADFRGSITPLLLLLPGAAALSIVNVLAAYIGGIGKPRLNLLVSLAALSVTVSLDLLLIPYLNIAGAAIARSASYSVSAVLTIWLFMRESGMPLRNVLVPTLGDTRLLLLLVRSTLLRMRFWYANWL